jgi:predicted metal-dependent hydrolase
MNKEKYLISITKSFRKSLSLRVDRNAVVQVKAPFFITKKQIEDFITKHHDWIETQQKKLPEKLSEAEI